MISNDVINSIYKKYSERPKSYDCLDFATLFEKAGQQHNLMVDPDTEELEIGSIAPGSPFHKLPLRNIHAFVPFEHWVAIVMHSSIIFLNARKPEVMVNIKQQGTSIWDRFFRMVV